ncbi:MAG TPA: 16S rRNA (uracil(1498)-N(3))-methyltransferase [Streptosporangiaceae bacterium]
MSAPVFLAETTQLDHDHVTLTGPEGRHAATVRRLRPGERVDLTDGAGRYVRGEVTAARKDTLEVAVHDRADVPAPVPALVVVQALAKGDRGELAVETMTEVGVDAIVPWEAAHCVARWRGDRAAKGVAKWRATAREAAKQARRAWFPEVMDVAETSEVVRRLADAELAVVLHEAAAEPLSALDLPESGTVVAVVGPEGGVSEEEIAAFTAAGARSVRLGPTVLRTSTAGAAAAAVIQARCGRW